MSNGVLLKQNEISKVIPKVEAESLPGLINNQVEKLNELDNSVKEAMDAAEVAKNSAIEASERSAGFGKKKVAIEELQSASVDLAKAVRVGAEAQKISFEFQSKLAEITKNLFGLGISNIANNRMVVRELEKRLQGASEEEISELAQQELMLVIQQLKEQQDLLRKLDNLETNIKTVKENLVNQFTYSRELNERLFEQKYSLEQLEEKFDRQAELNKSFENSLSKQDKMNKSNAQKIAFQAETNLKFEGKFQILFSESNHQQNQIEDQIKLNNQYDQQFNHVQQNIMELQKLSRSMEEQLDKFKDFHESHNQKFNKHQDVHQSMNEQLKECLQLIEQNNLQIKQLQEKNECLSTLVDKKSNATFSKVTLGIAIIGSILSIINFFI